MMRDASTATTDGVFSGVKRAALLFLAGLFGLSTLQVAVAQPGEGNPGTDNGSHTVTVNVENIDNISVEGSPVITIDSEGDLNDWIPDDGDGSVKVTSNAQDLRKVEVSAVSLASGDQNNNDDGTGSANLGNIGLRVSAQNEDDGTTVSEVTLFNVNDGPDNFSGSKDILTGFQAVKNSSFDVQYEAYVTPEYDPGIDTKINVQYTLTGN